MIIISTAIIITVLVTVTVGVLQKEIIARGRTQAAGNDQGQGELLIIIRSPNPCLRNYNIASNNRYGDQGKFWDGFQWVAKTVPKVRDFVHTTDVKKVQISGLPLELGLKPEDIRQELNFQLNANYHPESDIIKTVDLILAQNAIAIELGSREDISKIKDTFDGKEMLGQRLIVTSFEGKTINFNTTEMANEAASSSNPIANSAMTAAQAAAIGISGAE